MSNPAGRTARFEAQTVAQAGAIATGTKSVVTSVGAARLPVFEKLGDVSGANLDGRFEFPILLAGQQLSFAIQNGDCRNTLLERNVITRREIGVVFVPADVDMDHVEVGRDDWRDLLGMKRGVENVAVKAPVPSKDDDDVLMVACRGCQRRIEVLLGIGGGGIEIRIRLRRFRK